MLNDTRIRNAKPKKHRYRLSDSHGLALEVMTSGGKYWRYRYRLNGKENLFAGGEWTSAPPGETSEQAEARRSAGKLTLTEARAARMQWRADVKAGPHPRIASRARGLG